MVPNPNCGRQGVFPAAGGGGWRVWLAGLGLLLGSLSGQAQWLTQTNIIKSGWSAVYFYVDASSQNLGPMITNNPGNPIDQIWMWKYPASAQQYISNPESPLSGGGQWATWVRNPTNTVNTLAAIIPNAAYLIHSTASTPYTWAVQGVPAPPNYVWDMTGLNFIGFDTPTVNPPSFQKFFAPDPTISGLVQIYQYSGGAFSAVNPEPVFSQYSTPVTRGQAYWVSATNVNNTYFGPFSVTLPNTVGLQYGTNQGQFTLQLVNESTNTLTVSAQLLPSETPPAGQTPIVGTPPLLVEGAVNTTNLTYGYTTLNQGMTNSWTLAPAGKSGSDIQVVIGINRYAMTAAPGSLYAGILQFTDSLGYLQVNVPVSGNAGNNAGLWVGMANITDVGSYLKSYVTNISGTLVTSTVTNAVYTTNALPTPAGFLETISVNTEQFTTNNYSQINEFSAYTVNPVSSSSTNETVVVTNETTAISGLLDESIVTTVTGYTYAGGNIVWITANATNVLASSYVTNLIVTVATNQIIPADNRSTEIITNQWLQTSIITNLISTNGIFQGPVTNLTVCFMTVTNPVISTNSTTSKVTTTVTRPAVFEPTLNGYSSLQFQGAGGSTTKSVVATNYTTQAPLAVFTNGDNYICINPLITSTNYISLQEHFITYLLYPQTNFYNYDPDYPGYGIPAGTFNYSETTTGTVLAGTTTTVLGATTNLLIATNSEFSITTNYVVAPGPSYEISTINTNLGPVPTPYPLRLIIFNDGTNSSLLQRVYYGIRQNTNVVVATTESVLDVAHLNTARRITATSLPWQAVNTPWPFSGLLTEGGFLTTTVTEPYDDQAANPFLHTYHPDHNNLTPITDPTVPPYELPRGSESYDIARTISLQIVPNTANFITLTTANSTLTGNYLETITLTGLGGSTRSFSTAGSFSLTRISPIATLTTQ